MAVRNLPQSPSYAGVEALRKAGGLVVAGSLFWLVHLGFTMAGVLLFAVYAGMNNAEGAAIAGAILFAGALIAATVGAFLLAGGAFFEGAVARGISAGATPGMRVHPAMGKVEQRGDRAGFCLLAFGACGIFAGILLVALGDLGPTLRPGSVLGIILGVGLVWVAASAVFAIAAADLTDSLDSIGRHVPSLALRPAPNLRGYAYLYLAGTLALILPLLPYSLAPPSPLQTAVCFFLFGLVIQGVIVPLAGFATFVRLTRFGLEATRVGFPPPIPMGWPPLPPAGAK